MYVFKLYRGDVLVCTNQQSIRDVYLDGIYVPRAWVYKLPQPSKYIF